jgi:hypothetical protein
VCALTSESTRTPCDFRSLRSLLAQVAGYTHVMPQAVVFAFSLLASLFREHRASCVRFAVARKLQPFAIAVNRCKVSVMADRASAVALLPVVPLGQAAGNAAGLARRQLPRPSRLPPASFVFSSQARRVAGAVASIGPPAPVSLRHSLRGPHA